jgi:hypothetical protein
LRSTTSATDVLAWSGPLSATRGKRTLAKLRWQLSTFAREASGWPALIVASVCILLAVAALPAHTQAALAGPPRPKPAHASTPVGATIALSLRFDPLWPQASIPWQDLWTVVQWQDRGGNWHDVEGWQGTPDGIVDGEGRKVWWLSWELFGQGPFRWAIYAARGGEALANSEPFYLAAAPCQLLRIEVWLEPPPLDPAPDPP